MNAEQKPVKASLPARYRGAVAARTAVTVIGAYLLSACFAAGYGLVCTHWLQMPRADAVTLSTMLSFIVFAVAVLWGFACRSGWRKCWGLGLPTAVMAVLVWALSGGQA